MAQILSGKEVAAAITENTRQKADAMRAAGRPAHLRVIRVGDKKSDLAYEKGIRKRSEAAGVDLSVDALPEDATFEDVKRAIERANADWRVKGVLLFLPLPKALDEKKLVNFIAPEKDLDGATDISMLGVYKGTGAGFPPCTPEAVVRILDYYGIEISGKDVVIVGRSLVVGKPLAQMLIARNATVTTCHTKTVDLAKKTAGADILISAAGHRGTIRAEHVREGQVVIDVGINFDDTGKMTGDVEYEEVKNIVSAITPVPGGVGSVTNAVLLAHICEGKVR
ncbi:MAG: tetrahydrofolate dehydrogenase/cyclohydrolase catalytic domain-containing protein [Lachnospiraceae bacterium]|nr:tetrahydrofolate dehydrogenase/cyclohydrolase catalytic domain-containing protein [Lachnospiraceae bacterium]